jgi:hypothetical protein
MFTIFIVFSTLATVHAHALQPLMYVHAHA